MLMLIDVSVHWRGWANDYKFKTVSKFIVWSQLSPVVTFDYSLN